MPSNPQNPQYNYKQLSASANVSANAAQIGGIFVSSVSGSPTITVYDSATTTTTTKIIDTFIPVAATWYPMPYSAVNGIYLVIASTVSCTVAWL